MRTRYRQLTADDRNRIQKGLNEGLSRREIARGLGRWPSAVSREIARNRVGVTYDAVSAGQRTRSRCRRGRRKLVVGTALLQEVHTGLLGGWSPEQIAGRLKQMHPDEPTERVAHETIYSYIYAQPRGELRKTLIAALRQAHKKRLARSRGTDRRGHLRDMVSRGGPQPPCGWISYPLPTDGDQWITPVWRSDMRVSERLQDASHYRQISFIFTS